MPLRLTRILLAGAAIAAAAIVLPASAADQAVPAAKEASESAAPAQKVSSDQAPARPARMSIRRATSNSFVVKRRPARFAQRFLRRSAGAGYSRPRVARAWVVRPAVRYAFLSEARVHHSPMILVGVGY